MGFRFYACAPGRSDECPSDREYQSMPIRRVAEHPLSLTGESVLSKLGRVPTAVLRTVAVWSRRSRERRELCELLTDDRLLADIGITRDQALREAAKPFWRS